MRPLFAIVPASAALLVAGCMLLTGGTDGYTDAGTDGVACTAPGDCDVGFCCIVPTGTACLSSCAAPEYQMCTIASDCGDGGACYDQSCLVDGGRIPVSTCGALPWCTQ